MNYTMSQRQVRHTLNVAECCRKGFFFQKRNAHGKLPSKCDHFSRQFLQNTL